MSQTHTLKECDNEQNILTLYSSQRDEVLNTRNTENQNLCNAQECAAKNLDILREKIKYSYDLENENDILKDHIQTGLEIRNELVSNIMKCNELMNTNVERVNLLQNVIQLCVSSKNNIENLKQEFISKFEKILTKKQHSQEIYIENINLLTSKIKSCKEEILKSIESYESSNQIDMQEILSKKQMLMNIQTEIQNLDEILNKLNKEKIIEEEKKINQTNDQLEVEKANQEFIENQNLEIAEFKKKIFDLEEMLNSINYDDLEKNNLEEGCNNKTEFVNSLKNQINNLEESISIKKTEYFNKEKEVNAAADILQQEVKINTDLINLKKEIEDKKKDNWSHEEQTALKQKLAEFPILENELKSQILNSEEVLMKIENEIKITQDLFKEGSNKFSNDVLHKKLEEKEQNEQLLNAENQEMRTKLDELDVFFEEFVTKFDIATKEEEEEEISINMEIDTTGDEIKNQESYNKNLELEKKNFIVKEKQEQIKSEFEEKDKELTLEFDERKNNLNEFYQKSRPKLEDLKKIKDSKTNLELQLSEYNASNESLNNALKLKIEHLEKLKEDLNNKTEKKLKKAEELEKDERTFKKPRHDSIPKYKVSPSKYSSTSDSSVENYNLAKRRKVTFKRRPRDKKTESSQKSAIQGSQKSINDAFDALKPTSKRSIKKPVF